MRSRRTLVLFTLLVAFVTLSIVTRPVPMPSTTPRFGYPSPMSHDVEMMKGMSLDEVLGDDGAAVCELFLLAHEACQSTKSAAACIDEYGVDAWSEALPSRCTETAWWHDRRLRSAPDATSPMLSKQSSAKLRDVISRAKLFTGRRRQVPPQLRTPTPFAFKQTKYGPVYATSFAYPDSMIRSEPSRTKIFDWGLVLPGLVLKGDNRRRQHPVTWKDEYLLHALNRHAYFAFSHFRGGWDCMRHLDILSTGAIPYIPDIEWCDEYCLSGYPKALIREAMSLPGVAHIGRLAPNQPFFENRFWMKEKDRRWVDFGLPGIIDRSRFSERQYWPIAEKIMRYTQTYLKCSSVVAAMLKSMGIEEPKSVLLLQNHNPDFQGFSINCGLAELGINYTTHVIEKPLPWGRAPWEQVDEATLYARSGNSTRAAMEQLHLDLDVPHWYVGGYVWALRAIPPPNPRLPLEELKQRMLAREFDAVIFNAGNPYTHALLDDAVRSVANPSHVAFVNGADQINDEGSQIFTWWRKQGVSIFIRELQLFNASKV